MKRIIWRCVAMSAVLATGAAQAQTTLVTDEIAAPPYAARDEMVVERGPYAALPPADIYGEEIIPPFHAVRILRATGYQPLSRPFRRGLTYMVAVVNPQGLEGRAVLDAHTGRLVRFVPEAYGADPAASYAPPPTGPSARPMMARPGPRPPALVPHASVPHMASRTPPAEPAAKSSARLPEEQKPPAASAAATPATQQQQAAASPPRPSADASAAKPPAPPKPAVALQPTQPMPPVQDFE